MRYQSLGRLFTTHRVGNPTLSKTLLQAASDWGARSQFPPKKKDSDDLRVVHNFIPVNRFTIKPQYPMHKIDEALDTLIKPKFLVFFCTDAANGYWAIPVKGGDQYKKQ